MIKCPCTKECPSRTPECRKTCEAYREYEEYKREDYAQRTKKVQFADDIICLERRRSKNRLKGIR